jgi:UrcA family protein
METGKRVSNVSLACLAVLAAAALAGAGSASAAQSTQSSSVTISYGDLDLSTTSGAHALYARLSGAARVVCGDSGRSLVEQRAWQHCYSHALSDAVERIDSPLLDRDARRDTSRMAMLGR